MKVLASLHHSLELSFLFEAHRAVGRIEYLVVAGYLFFLASQQPGASLSPQKSPAIPCHLALFTIWQSSSLKLSEHVYDTLSPLRGLIRSGSSSITFFD